MKIKAGDYTLKSDRFSMWIEEEYISEEEKSKGKLMTRRVAGYSTSWKNLLNDFIEKNVNGSDADTVQKLIKVIGQTIDDAKALNEVAVKSDFKIIRGLGKEKK